MEICQSDTHSSLIRFENRDYTLYADGKLYSHSKDKWLKPRSNGSGYMVYVLGNTKFYMHRLLATVWVPNPNQLPEVNHIDEDKSNNSISNLEWITRAGNMKHSYDKICKGQRRNMHANQATWIGQQNSTRTVIALTGKCNSAGNYQVLVECQCGNRLTMYYNDFLKDKVKSCAKCRSKKL